MVEESRNAPAAVVVGASRGLGLAVTRGLLERGWGVTATIRSAPSPEFERLQRAAGPRLQTVRADITRESDIEALARTIGRAAPQLLHVNAGITDPDVPVGQVATQTFVDVMLTNALAPMRVVEHLGPLVTDDGVIAVVSSRQGSISYNTRGGHEVYRASKAALNQLMRSYAARQSHGGRTLLLLHPGWVRTALGGDEAPLSIQDSASGLVDVVTTHRSRTLEFLDHRGETVPW